MTNIIQLKNVSTGYNHSIVLRNVTIDISKDDFIGVIGPNGGGKTTFIKLILGLLPPFSGSLKVNLAKNETIGYVPQHNLFDNKFPIKAIDVVLSGLLTQKGLFGRYKSTDFKKAEAQLEQNGIQHLKNKNIGELSGGEMQKVFLSRALISSPKLLILDEPNTYVDSDFEGELYERLKELNKEMAILLISHDIGIISAHVKSIACINKDFHYHPSNKISNEQLASYNCPIKLIAHGNVPHTVLEKH